MKPGEFLNMHCYDSKIGSGWRCVLVLTIGRKWTRLFYPPTCEVVSLPNAVAEKIRAEPIKIRGALAKRIRATAGLAPTEATKEALAMLREVKKVAAVL